MKTKNKAKKNFLNTGASRISLMVGAVAVLVIIVSAFQITQLNNTAKNIASKQDAGNVAGTTDNTGPLADAAKEQAATQESAPGSQPSTSTSTDSKNTTSTAPKTTAPSTQPSVSAGSSTGTSAGASNNTTPTSTDGDTPQVTLTYPYYWGQMVTGTMTMTATASDSSGVEKVVFMVRRIGYATPVSTQTDTTAPYSAQFDTTSLPNGGSEYTVEAQVFDKAGKGNLASYRINIQN